jgi:hypothetical protein
MGSFEVMKQNEKKFTERKFILLDLPISDNSMVDNPEQIVLKTGTYGFDIGALCYAERSTIDRVRGRPRLVDESSLIQNRIGIVKSFFIKISTLAESYKPATVISKITAFGRFIDWADTSLGIDYFTSADALEEAFFAYLNMMQEKHYQGLLEATTVNSVHLFVLEMVQIFIDRPHFGKDIRFLEWASNKQTIPASKGDFAHLLAFSQAIFTGLSDLILNEGKFPFQLKLPDSLNWERGNHLWVFPTQLWYLPPHQWGEYRKQLTYPFWAYNYETGKVSDPEEIYQNYNTDRISNKRYVARVAVKFANSRIKNANADARDIKRIRLARLALSAFAQLFIANTGANLAVVSSIEYSEKIAMGALAQNFRSIKYRANGKVIDIRIPASLLPHLRTYMKLRAYLLDGTEYPYLFFCYSKDRIRNISQLNEDQLTIFSRIIKNIDPSFKIIRPRQIRATANDWVVNKFGVTIAAKVMGHTVATELKKYGRGSHFYHLEDITKFLEKMSHIAKNQTIVSSKTATQSFIPIEAGGSCENFGNPKPLSAEQLVQPSCNGGCLFCSHRCLVADEEDVRKICSAIFVMEQVISRPEHETLLRPMIKKCEEDLLSISTFNGKDSMVTRVKNEVFELGNLTSYWSAKYSQYLELGVLK